MTLVRTFFANTGELSIGPSLDSDRSFSKNIGRVDGVDGIAMSDYYQGVVDSNNATQFVEGQPIAMSAFREKTGRLTENFKLTNIDDRNTTYFNTRRVNIYGNRKTLPIGKGSSTRSTRYLARVTEVVDTLSRGTRETTITDETRLRPVREIIRSILSRFS